MALDDEIPELTDKIGVEGYGLAVDETDGPGRHSAGQSASP
jgi:hypothetical protein